ncbi:coiled-coil domain-containing protein 66 isoform X7 [Panthera pardus]|uniref:Coiled-coil domain-containing protein 66 isoform X7 n=1 Tax=Panthera pardus TaxID=9691 RepID=A0A9V1GMT7_PANPR|nr:coiled-coil domain-containing protein 66 isoform X7 [Panthera pardus]
MNLGDGLKLETELLDGKTKLILSPYECKSKYSVKMGNKTKIAKCPLRTKQTGYILKSTQNTCIKSGKLLQKKRMGSETSQAKGRGSLHLNNISNQPNDENVMGVLQKTEALSSVLDESKSVLNKNQETSKQYEQKIVIENAWKPADIFSTLGERERDRSLLEAKKAQWRKELGRTLFTDEQVALKKKEKEASEKWNNPWKKFESDKRIWEKFQILDQSKTCASSSSILSQSPCQVTVVQADGHPLIRVGQILEEAVPLEHSFNAVKQEQQRKWIEDLNKQTDDRQRKTEEKITSSKGEEHDRWTMHFGSLRNYPASQSQLSFRSTYNQPEYFCVSPETQELADINSVYTPMSGSHVEPSEEEHIAKPLRDTTMANSQKTNFLRSMTALLDPAQIEERDRRRQKQLEHQKAITAQVEEKRRKKQLEEQQRKKEEQEEECRLAREREEMQKQYEEDILKQKQKEEIMALKTNELFQTMQRAQELAQRLKQEQRIRELAQKGHDTSGLIKNLGGHGLDDVSDKMNICINSTTSPKKDTAVQTDDLNTGMFTNAESCCGSVIEREIINCSSPEIPAEFSEQLHTKKDKQELTNQDKGANLEKENSWYNDQWNEFTRTEKTKPVKKCPKRPDWNINKPLKRYIPASEKYPKQLQKQREEKKVRRQMELLNLVERNSPGHLSQNRGPSPVLPSSQETEPRFRWHLIKKEEDPLKINSFSKERSPSPPPVPVVKNRTQQTQTLNSNYERENLILEGSQTETSPGVSEPSHFIPYVRTNEIYYLDPDAPLSRPLTQDLQYQNPHDCDQEQGQLLDFGVRDPLLNPNLLKNRDRQQAILKGLSELRQGLLQKQRELETNLMPLAANQEENFNSSF